MAGIEGKLRGSMRVSLWTPFMEEIRELSGVGGDGGRRRRMKPLLKPLRISHYNIFRSILSSTGQKSRSAQKLILLTFHSRFFT